MINSEVNKFFKGEGVGERNKIEIEAFIWYRIDLGWNIKYCKL